MRIAGALVIVGSVMLGLYFMLRPVSVSALSITESCGSGVFAWIQYGDGHEAERARGQDDNATALAYEDCVTQGRADTILGLIEGAVGTCAGAVVIGVGERRRF